MMPALSLRNFTGPAFAFLPAVATSAVTEPSFGFGIRPRGPSNWPSLPTTRIASGVAITTPKSMSPPCIFSARSSMPTTSAPAALAASAFSPAGQNTATRTVLPVPCGSTVEPRTPWSDFLASMPRRIATSTDSTNLVLALSLRIFNAASIGYGLPGSTWPAIALKRFVSAMSDALHVETHAARAAGDGAHGRVQIRRGQVGLFLLGDVFQLLARHLAHLVGVGLGRTRLDADRLLEQHGRGRGLGDEGEAAVRIRGDDHRDRQALLDLLRGGVEGLAEFHDVEATLAQRRTNRRAGVGLTGLDLQLDVTDDLLCHVQFSFEFKRLAAPRVDESGTGNRERGGVSVCSRSLFPLLLSLPVPALMPFPPARTPAPPGSNARKSAPPRAGGSFRN